MATSDPDIQLHVCMHLCSLPHPHPHINMKRKPPSLQSSTHPPISTKTVVLKPGSTQLEEHLTKYLGPTHQWVKEPANVYF